LQIDKEIIMELKNEPDEIELLLLGACESGKSTFLKQVLILCHLFDHCVVYQAGIRPVDCAFSIIFNYFDYCAYCLLLTRNRMKPAFSTILTTVLPMGKEIDKIEHKVFNTFLTILTTVFFDLENDKTN
jgi:hypothetical protein